MKEESIMKTTFRIIIASMAASAVLASCRKELNTENTAGPIDGVRTISVQFDNSTKACFDGLTPKFENGDKIMVANATESKECTVSVEGNNVTFTTDLTGALTAIYPEGAAVLAGGDGSTLVDPGYKVPATQDGKAIIAKATIGAEETGANFVCQTAVFEITPPAGATSITIKSLKPIGTDGQRSGTAEAINTDGADDAAKCVITVDVRTDGKAYASLKAGVKLSDLSFDAGPTYGMKGIPTSVVTAASKPNATASNTRYSIGNADGSWHPYVEITMNSKTYKWAKMNVGATEETGLNSYGKYFSWAEVSGHAPSSGSFESDFASFDHSDERYPDTWNAALFFNDCNTPYYDGSDYSGSDYNNSTGKTVLDLADDAANANWGGSWRMPTKAEFDALCSEIISWDSTNKGYKFGTYPSQIFLPAAGGSTGDGKDLCEVGADGCYWTSSLFSGDSSAASYLYFFEGSAYTYIPTGRYIGQSVRALSE